MIDISWLVVLVCIFIALSTSLAPSIPPSLSQVYLILLVACRKGCRVLMQYVTTLVLTLFNLKLRNFTIHHRIINSHVIWKSSGCKTVTQDQRKKKSVICILLWQNGIEFSLKHIIAPWMLCHYQFISLQEAIESLSHVSNALLYFIIFHCFVSCSLRM